MRTLGRIALTIGLLIIGLIFCYKLTFPTYTYRYRMTVEVMVAGVVRSSASVIEVKINKQPKFGQAPPQVSRYYGEAVFVDLGNGRNVIALLAAGPKAENVNYSYNVVPTLFGLTFNDRDLMKLADLYGSRDLPMNYLPTFVTFTDLNDPKTARVVGAGEFEQVFGKDVRFKGARVEVTSDPITRGIEAKMPGIIRQLREEARVMQTRRATDPFAPGLGHFHTED